MWFKNENKNQAVALNVDSLLWSRAEVKIQSLIPADQEIGHFPGPDRLLGLKCDGHKWNYSIKLAAYDFKRIRLMGSG